MAGGESSAATTAGRPLAEALAAHARGEAEAAAALYARVLEREPDEPTALHNLGILRAAEGRAEEALGLIRRAIEAAPGTPEAHHNLAALLARFGRGDEARAAYERALAVKPDYAEALAGLGDLAAAGGEEDAAEALYLRALAADPQSTAALTNLGVLLMARGRRREAGERFAVALGLQPQSAEAHYNVANALKAIGRFEDAEGFFRTAIELNPRYADAWTNLGNVLRERNDLDGALLCHRQVETLRPNAAAVKLNLGHILRDRGDAAAARAMFAEAQGLDPSDPSAALARCMAELPLMYADEAEIAACRARYAAALETLIAQYDADPRPEAWARAIGASQPFYLAYQGQDDRALQQRYGAFVCRVMADRYGPADLTPPPVAGERIRVGIVSGFFSAHSNWKIPIRGWVERLDRDRFEVIGFHTAAKQDASTADARRLCDRFVQGPLSVDAWRAAILSERPHMLIYPEVGMDPIAVRLAAQRLTRLQCASWGHPDTTGFPTLDAYLSSTRMEPQDGDAHYSERLVRLPGLGVWYEPGEAEVKPLDRATLGYREGAVVYWCAQSLPKYLPRFDGLYPRIAEAVGDCQFVFIGLPQASEADAQFKRRIADAFAARGLSAERHCVFLPRLTKGQFLGAIANADVVLDSLEWSGCNSTLESLGARLPVVTHRGRFMRGRHTSAILEMMGVTETIAEDVDEYVALASRLGTDADWREAMSRAVAANKAKLYRDQSTIDALERFIEEAVR